MTAGEFREQFECAKCRAQRRIESRLQSLEDSSSRVSFAFSVGLGIDESYTIAISRRLVSPSACFVDGLSFL